jgi:nascent polypeptide-associated complex subunit alpha
MIPGMNPRAMKQAMKKMGMTQVDIDASEVIIKTADKNLVIRNPQVAKINMMGQESFQITGNVEVVESGPNLEDLEMVMDQAKCSKEVALGALEKANGDLAQAIMDLQEEGSQ